MPKKAYVGKDRARVEIPPSFKKHAATLREMALQGPQAIPQGMVADTVNRMRSILQRQTSPLDAHNLFREMACLLPPKHRNEVFRSVISEKGEPRK